MQRIEDRPFVDLVRSVDSRGFVKRPFRALMLLPDRDFDPTESAVPWRALIAAGCEVRFATPSGQAGAADERLLETGFGPLSPLLMPSPVVRELYRTMAASPEFKSPLRHAELDAEGYDLVHVPGGHAEGMKSLLESESAMNVVAHHMEKERPTSAVCHGVLLLARAKRRDGRSVLFGRKTTALTSMMENTAWSITRPFLGNYYRTYPESVESEVKRALEKTDHFKRGPWFSRRDSEEHPERGFVVIDRKYVSARWPGDCHALGRAMVAMVTARELPAA